jgi:toxin FitB
VNGYLLDTNVLSELRKGERADVCVQGWFRDVAEESVFLSVLVLGEIRSGIERIRNRDAMSAAALDRWLAKMLTAYAERILPVDHAIADEWGRLVSAGSLPVVDGLLAATAKVHDLTLVTRNVKDVARTKVNVLDPFKARQ